MRYAVKGLLTASLLAALAFAGIGGVALAQVDGPEVEEVLDLRPGEAAAEGGAAGGADVAAAPVETDANGNERLITMDFQDVDLPVLVKFISEITGKNFIVDDKVRGKITIISPGRISVDEAYLVFQSVLQVKGFTTVQAGAIIKIVQTAEAKSSTLETILPERPSPARTDQFITRLIPLEFVSADAMVAIIQPLVSPDGLLAAYAKTNTLIMIDTAAQTERISEILAQLDVEGGEQKFEVIRLRYALASDLAAILQEVLTEPDDAAGADAGLATRPGAAPDARIRRGRAQAAAAARLGGQTTTVTGGSAQSAFRIIPDDRLNSLIVMAGLLEMRRIQDLVARLDVPLPLGTGRIHVYYLKYANAMETTDVLGALVGGGGGFGGGIGGGGLGGGQSRFGNRSGGFRSGGRFGGTSSGFGSEGMNSSSSFGQSSRFGSGSRFGGGTGGSSLGQTGLGGGFGGRTGAASVGGGLGGDQQSQFEGEVAITADPATNSLIIVASPQDYETIKDVIDKLDVRRRQVYVEAIIAEVSANKTRELGIELQGATEIPGGVGFGRTNLAGDLTSAGTNPFGLQGLALGAASAQSITVGGVTVPAQQVIMRALERTSDAEILSAPTLLTTDNIEAELVAGQNVPFIASRSSNEVNLDNTFATIERQDVGVTLRITPQISDGGTVRLDIYQEVSAVIATDPELGPTTSVRSATTTIVVKNGHTAVIGGLMANRELKDQNRVPFISDIPVIGNFFEFDSVTNDKVNLLIFLTPHIIWDEPQQSRLSISERERLIQKPFEERGKAAPDWEALRRPSWEPPADAPPADPRGATRPQAEPADSLGAEEVQEPASDFAADGETGSTAAGSYVLLATVASSGQPPPALVSSNGLVALSVRGGSELAGFFRSGSTYTFADDNFEASFHCLDLFATAKDALTAYPEGMRISVTPPTFLHWRDPGGSTAGLRGNWATGY
jgi:general secretion pathway protein D